MAGAAITVDIVGLATAAGPIEHLASLERSELLDGLGRLVQEQTRRRIRETKTGPDGQPWTPNRAGTSILLKEGTLANSIDYAIEGNQVAVGSGLVYARIHQLGGTIVPKNAQALRFVVGSQLVFSKKVTIPARPYLGVSGEDQEEIEATVLDFLALVAGEGATP
ncbi:phage virion morphogenesis protein [Kaistia sp. MMO-174]|uniref:phage virion morphogenesis protein n=1 Tax=Kaistia sp. MMO-174 TaxID=3081256 RepID=UPI003016A9D2